MDPRARPWRRRYTEDPRCRVRDGARAAAAAPRIASRASTALPRTASSSRWIRCRWAGAFDFVHETYTLQALMPGTGLREKAVKCLAGFLKPGGRLIFMDFVSVASRRGGNAKVRARAGFADYATAPCTFSRATCGALGHERRLRGLGGVTDMADYYSY